MHDSLIIERRLILIFPQSDQAENYGIVSAQILSIPLPHRQNVWSKFYACVIS